MKRAWPPKRAQAGRRGQDRAEAGEQQRRARAERGDEHAAEADRAELGGVAGGVVGREGAAVERVRDAGGEQ